MRSAVAATLFLSSVVIRKAAIIPESDRWMSMCQARIQNPKSKIILRNLKSIKHNHVFCQRGTALQCTGCSSVSMNFLSLYSVFTGYFNIQIKDTMDSVFFTWEFENVWLFKCWGFVSWYLGESEETGLLLSGCSLRWFFFLNMSFESIDLSLFRWGISRVSQEKLSSLQWADGHNSS